MNPKLRLYFVFIWKKVYHGLWPQKRPWQITVSVFYYSRMRLFFLSYRAGHSTHFHEVSRSKRIEIEVRKTKCCMYALSFVETFNNLQKLNDRFRYLQSLKWQTILHSLSEVLYSRIILKLKKANAVCTDRFSW